MLQRTINWIRWDGKVLATALTLGTVVFVWNLIKKNRV